MQSHKNKNIIVGIFVFNPQGVYLPFLTKKQTFIIQNTLEETVK